MRCRTRRRSRGRVAVGAAILAVVTAATLSGCAGTWFKPAAPALHISVDDCPVLPGAVRDVSNGKPLTRLLLREDARPTAALLCTYEATTNGVDTADTASAVDAAGSTEGPAGVVTLMQGVHVQETDAVALATSILTLSLAPQFGVAGCPMDAGGTFALIVFHYPDGADTDLYYHDTGCETLDNGSIGAGQVDSTSFNDFQVKFSDLIGPVPGAF
ncbi:hypothetical protein [Subtercola vilae]|uniref:hypothetical protein n=1 Tax=Subtercola vilae TaxID=2056433 RepID=UPI0010AAC42E|nr:hypothetical protein [Subtercola vilae]